MSWKEISVDVPEALKDAVHGELYEQGASGTWEIEDSGLGSSRIVAFFQTDFDVEAVCNSLHVLFSRAGLPSPSIALNSLEDHDWTEEWKKSYKSFPIGKGFFVIPSWRESDSSGDRLPIHIDPGQAFGTGTHETTQLTLEALERWLEPEQRILDLGTGSGILAIASRMLGATDVFACDIDPTAVQVAIENLIRNDAQEVQMMCGSIDAVRDRSVDLLLCNLTAEMILQILPEIDRAMRPKGLVIFSGILSTQLEDIHSTLKRSGYVVHEEITRGEWLALVTQKNVA